MGLDEKVVPFRRRDEQSSVVVVRPEENGNGGRSEIWKALRFLKLCAPGIWQLPSRPFYATKRGRAKSILNDPMEQTGRVSVVSSLRELDPRIDEKFRDDHFWRAREDEHDRLSNIFRLEPILWTGSLSPRR